MVEEKSSVTPRMSLVCVLLVYTIWGIQPLYWQLFNDISLSHILAHRIIWSVLFLLPIVVLTKRWDKLIKVLQSLRLVLITFICAIAIGANWLLNIYAAATKQVVEASLGHYITPIIIIVLGVFALKESFQPYKFIATFLVVIGVVILTLYVGKLPVIAIFLVITFAVYTFAKKVTLIDPVVGITVETLILLTLAIIYLYVKSFTGEPFFATGAAKDALLLISTGIFTSVPLLLFSIGVRGINLSNLGFIQYYAPSLSLIVGVFIFHEQFSSVHLLCFGLIWIAILIVLLTPLAKRKSQAALLQKING